MDSNIVGDIAGTQSPASSNPADDTAQTTSAPSKFFLPGISYDDFIQKDILDLMGVKDMPPEQKAELYETIIATIQDRVILKLIELMSDEDYADLENCVDLKDATKFEQIVQRNHIDLPQIFAEEALAYKIQMVNLAQGNKAAKEE